MFCLSGLNGKMLLNFPNWSATVLCTCVATTSATFPLCPGPVQPTGHKQHVTAVDSLAATVDPASCGETTTETCRYLVSSACPRVVRFVPSPVLAFCNVVAAEMFSTATPHVKSHIGSHTNQNVGASQLNPYLGKVAIFSWQPAL